jgi:uroporphyrinogen decarboxylase
MSIYLQPAHSKAAEELVAASAAHGGLAPLDIESFWRDDAEAHSDIWSARCPQMPLGIRMSAECVFAELDEPEDWHRHYHDGAYKQALCKRYNDRAEEIVGRRLLDESPPPSADKIWPQPKQLYDIFEAKNIWNNESYWLMQVADTPQELEALLDRVEKRLKNLREFLFPTEWHSEKKRLQELGIPAPIYRSQRGPVTFATSIFGVENLIYLLVDQPDLAQRFSTVLRNAILARAALLDAESGWAAGAGARGWYWLDDNCCTLNNEMYEFFARPILAAVFAVYSPDPQDRRGQHSDSDMAHQLPSLAALGLNEVNLGPNLSIAEIRQALPRAAIYGQLAPFSFSRNEEVNLVAECIRDAEMARAERGVVFATAGSINNGSRLTSLRLLMAAIQRYGRY